MIKRYSPSELKYDKKITATTEKQQYEYRISDIHYEVDMSMLGCNSRLLWHETFLQIIDIISVKSDKTGILLCKNFHLIHNELLEIFYSYIQQFKHSHSSIKVVFFIMTENLSFIPTTIYNSCQLFRIPRPSKEQYERLLNSWRHLLPNNHSNSNSANVHPLLENLDIDGITNIKELKSLLLVDDINDSVPKDIFNIICDNIITEMLAVNEKPMSFTGFRDTLYDILTYNLDVVECLWYILKHFVETGRLLTPDVSDILQKTYLFLKQYNNNYRPIYHLESIFFYIINKIHGFSDVV